MATYFGIGKSVTKLIAIDYNINAKGSDSSIPLHWASGNGHDTVV
jgi:ankyrin repeat protein